MKEELTIHDKINLVGFRSLTAFAKHIGRSRSTLYRWQLDEEKHDAKLCILYLDLLKKIQELEAKLEAVEMLHKASKK